MSVNEETRSHASCWTLLGWKFCSSTMRTSSNRTRESVSETLESLEDNKTLILAVPWSDRPFFSWWTNQGKKKKPPGLTFYRWMPSKSCETAAHVLRSSHLHAHCQHLLDDIVATAKASCAKGLDAWKGLQHGPAEPQRQGIDGSESATPWPPVVNPSGAGVMIPMIPMKHAYTLWVKKQNMWKKKVLSVHNTKQDLHVNQVQHL